MRNMPETIKGGIRPLEMEAFRHHIRPGDRIECYKPRWRADEAKELATMTVMGIYPHILVMGYGGRDHKGHTTSMTWAEAVILNRMTQRELRDEMKWMKMGPGTRRDGNPARGIRPGRRRVDRRKYVARIMEYREKGMTYARIAMQVGISASLVRDIYLKEGANQDV